MLFGLFCSHVSRVGASGKLLPMRKCSDNHRLMLLISDWWQAETMLCYFDCCRCISGNCFQGVSADIQAFFWHCQLILRQDLNSLVLIFNITEVWIKTVSHLWVKISLMPSISMPWWIQIYKSKPGQVPRIWCIRRKWKKQKWRKLWIKYRFLN